eukprot:2020881-Heterocapsa_arctica.AAC.1
MGDILFYLGGEFPAEAPVASSQLCWRHYPHSRGEEGGSEHFRGGVRLDPQWPRTPGYPPFLPNI